MFLNHRGTEGTEKGEKEKLTPFPDRALTEAVIGCAIEVHKSLGPGLYESVYQACMAWELSHQGIKFESQKKLPLVYKGLQLEDGYRLDFLIEGKLIVELKAIDHLLPINEAQLLTYMKLVPARLGLLINFNHELLKQGIKRLAL